jgi:hypothetical protein
MSYDCSTMRLMGGVPGQQLFLYRTADAVSAVSTAGYFNAAVDEYNLSSGDVILAVTGFGGTAGLAAMTSSVANDAVSVTRLA